MHRQGAMRRPGGGFTLLELMIVVVIVGVLVAIAVFTYQRWVRKTESTEVNYVFGEFKLRQERFALGNKGRYLSTGADETDTWPLPMGGQELVEWDGVLKPTTWNDLGVNLDRQGLHCTYVAVAGLADDDTNIGAKAIEFGFTVAPANNWYYLLAECDWDGRPTNSFYFQASDSDRLIKENDGN